MARRSRAYRERSFDPTKPVYVRKPFNGGGRKWKQGDHYDWTRLAVAQRRVRQLFDSGKLMHDEQELEPQRVDKPNEKRVNTEAGPVSVQTPDELDDITDMKELQRIAREEGAKTTTSKTLQRKHIRDNRNEVTGDGSGHALPEADSNEEREASFGEQDDQPSDEDDASAEQPEE